MNSHRGNAGGHRRRLAAMRLLDHALRQDDVAAGGQVRKQVELLEDHADLQA